MTTAQRADALVAALNTAQPGQLADMLRALKLGDFIRAMPVPINRGVPEAAASNKYVAAAAQPITLPDDAKAAYIFRAYAETGTGTCGELTCDAAQTGTASNPSAAHVGISPNGDLVFHGADAYTLVDVLYLPAKQDIVELTLPFATSILTIPSKYKALMLLEAEVITGTIAGKVIVDGPGTSTASGHAELSLDKTTVVFNSAQAGSSGTARVKLGVKNAVDLHSLLEAASNYLA